MCSLGRILALLALLGVAGCSYPVRNQAIATGTPPKYKWDASGTNRLDDTLIIFTASGGGTRATALAMAVLQTMAAVRMPAGDSLADEVDIISSVSGGSVTAGYFALTGTAGLPTLEKSFVRRDGMTPLIVRALNPVGLVQLSMPSKERIDLLMDYLDQQLFKDATYQALIGRRPYLILNAADMVEGVPFPFTQSTMDLLCSDLTQMKLSTAVAASAAFPVVLSPVTLKNYRPCKTGAVWVDKARETSWYENPARVVWGRTAEGYVSGRKQYVHLLDGGIADNLGVAEPYRLLTGDDEAPLLKNDIAQGRIKKILFVMVNARSAKSSELDAQQATPGVISMLSASIGSSSDRATQGMAERLRSLLLSALGAQADQAARAGAKDLAANIRTAAANTQLIAIDFDAIQDDTCRQNFHAIDTTWSLPRRTIDALKAMGEALLAQHPNFPVALSLVGGVPTKTFTTIPAACALLSDQAG